MENVARERAKADYEEEKRMLQDKMECEMAKMDAELKIFKTVKVSLCNDDLQFQGKRNMYNTRCILYKGWLKSLTS